MFYTLACSCSCSCDQSRMTARVHGYIKQIRGNTVLMVKTRSGGEICDSVGAPCNV